MPWRDRVGRRDGARARGAGDAWRLLARYYRPHVPALVAAVVLAAAQSASVVPVLRLIRASFDVTLPGRDVPALIRMSLVILALRLLTSALGIGLRHATLSVTKGAVAGLRHDLVGRLFAAGAARRAPPDTHLHTRVVQDTERVDQLSYALLSVVMPAGIGIAALLSYLCYLNWHLVLWLALALPVCFVAARIPRRAVDEGVRDFRQAFEAFSQGVRFVLRHRRLVELQGYLVDASREQRAGVDALRARDARMAMRFTLARELQRTIANVVGVALLIAGGVAIARGAMTVGSFLSFYVAAKLLTTYLDSVSASLPELAMGVHALEALARLLDGAPANETPTLPDLAFDGSVELRKVSFAYAETPVLQGVSLLLAPGAVTAIVGRNGAGKSTLLDVMVGLAQPTEGMVLASGVGYDAIDVAALRRSIGVVPQHPSFFAGTVHDNISYGRPHSSRGDVIASARRATAHDFIELLPQGYDTLIAEDGGGLSGGERQLIAVARALLGDKRLLILDEPTNHLEGGAIDRLLRSLTGHDDRPGIVIMSHDPRVLPFVDVIYRLEGGRLVPSRHEGGAGRRPLVTASP